MAGAIVGGVAGYALALIGFVVFRWANKKYVEAGPESVAEIARERKAA